MTTPKYKVAYSVCWPMINELLKSVLDQVYDEHTFPDWIWCCIELFCRRWWATGSSQYGLLPWTFLFLVFWSQKLITSGGSGCSYLSTCKELHAKAVWLSQLLGPSISIVLSITVFKIDKNEMAYNEYQLSFRTNGAFTQGVKWSFRCVNATLSRETEYIVWY